MKRGVEGAAPYRKGVAWRIFHSYQHTDKPQFERHKNFIDKLRLKNLFFRLFVIFKMEIPPTLDHAKEDRRAHKDQRGQTEGGQQGARLHDGL